MTTWAKPGVKCVCVDAASKSGMVNSTMPIEGRVYTIKSLIFWRDPDPAYESGWSVHLVEIDRPLCLTLGAIVPYALRRFRPLVTRSQAHDIAMIRELVETIDPIVACELTYADEIEARMVALDAAMNRRDLP